MQRVLVFIYLTQTSHKAEHHVINRNFRGTGRTKHHKRELLSLAMQAECGRMTRYTLLHLVPGKHDIFVVSP